VDVPQVQGRYHRRRRRCLHRDQGVRRGPAPLASPEDTVARHSAVPAACYPTYEMGAILRRLSRGHGADTAGRDDGAASISAEDAARALCLWVNSPANPGGHLEDLAAVAAWGRSKRRAGLLRRVLLEFTWAGPSSTILQHARGSRLCPLVGERPARRWSAPMPPPPPGPRDARPGWRDVDPQAESARRVLGRD